MEPDIAEPDTLESGGDIAKQVELEIRCGQPRPHPLDEVVESVHVGMIVAGHHADGACPGADRHRMALAWMGRKHRPGVAVPGADCREFFPLNAQHQVEAIDYGALTRLVNPDLRLQSQARHGCGSPADQILAVDNAQGAGWQGVEQIGVAKTFD